jgi:BCD family chlorophyll transporter-like MFS transporter
MYVMLLVGMIVSALAFGVALEKFSPGRLVQVIQTAAVLTVALNMIAMWKQEARRPRHGRPAPPPDPTFREAWANFCSGEDAVRRLVVVGIGTMAFGMADILLEPFGGQVLHMNVAATTKLTALLAFGGLLGFAYASYALGRGANAYRMTRNGALLGLPAFALVILAARLNTPALFLIGNFLVGFGGALFGHATLTACMSRAPEKQAGLALGAWGAVQATAAGIAVAMSGSLRDAVNMFMGGARDAFGFSAEAAGYITVYALEIGLLLVTIAAAIPLIKRRSTSKAAPHSKQRLSA